MIAIGCDHGGFKLKQEIIKYLNENDIYFKDVGTYDENSVDYPVYAKLVAKQIISGNCDKGILICTTGVGISMAANKIRGIRAALLTDVNTAIASRNHNDANVLCLGANVTDSKTAIEILSVFLNTQFSNEERHIKRIQQIDE